MAQVHLVEDGRAPDSMPIDRRSRILVAASQAFSSRGFKAASLRDIAAEAGVSLTLVNHYFGAKESLLSAVVAHHHALCLQYTVRLRAALHVQAGPLTLAHLAHAWVASEYALFDTPGGADYLALLRRLMNDEHVAPGVQRTLDCSEPVVLRALAVAAPGATQAARQACFCFARAVLLSSIEDGSPRSGPDQAGGPEDAAALCTRFLLGGLAGALQ